MLFLYKFRYVYHVSYRLSEMNMFIVIARIYNVKVMGPLLTARHRLDLHITNFTVLSDNNGDCLKIQNIGASCGAFSPKQI